MSRGESSKGHRLQNWALHKQNEVTSTSYLPSGNAAKETFGRSAEGPGLGSTEYL